MKTAAHVSSGEGEAKICRANTPTYTLYVHNLPPKKTPFHTDRTVARLHHTDNALHLWSPNVVSLCLIVP